VIIEFGQARIVDRITDFSAADVIDLSAIDANDQKAGAQAFKFIGEKAFSRAGGELRLTGSGFQVDTDGDRKADFTVKVFSDLDLVKGDFIL
jgi:hypothetical protein